MSLWDISLLVFFASVLVKIVVDFQKFMKETTGYTLLDEFKELFGGK